MVSTATGRAAFLAVLILSLPALVWAQAGIQGVVRDTSGAVLPGVTVEAASPALIEKIRTAVTDGNGRYQIVDLRPGTYSVTFSLAGFNTVKRDGVQLAGSAAVSIDADLRVGALEETITVTGDAPVVDTTSVTKQQVLNSDTVNALPSARNYFGLARMIPGTTGGGNDVGGSLIQDVGQSVMVHGSKSTDQRVTANGVSTMTLQAGGNVGGQTPDVGSAAEVTVDTTSLSAELPTGGVRINFIPRDGGNTFANNTFFSVTNEALQGDNFTERLQSAGFGTPNKVVKNLDLNESLGGPVKRDRLWFWFSTRINRTENEAAVFRNQNEFKPTEWLYVPDRSSPGLNKGEQFNNSLRLTWQATPKVKIAGTYKADTWCNCPNNISASQAPEAGRDRRFPRLRQEHAEMTSPITNKWLFEAVGLHLFERWGNMHLRPSTGSITEEQASVLPEMISVVEQSTNLRYRSLNTYNNTSVPSFTYRAAMSYVTGSHAIKFGFNNTSGYLDIYNYTLNPVEYRFNGGVPNQITQRAFPVRNLTNLDYDLGLYVQDRWTLNRVTVNLAGRFDNFKTSFPEQTVGASVFTPNRNITFEAQDSIHWKDLTYRTGLAYDVFGNGRTAFKVAFNKYLLGQTLNAIGTDTNPTSSMANTVVRNWSDADRDFTPDCDLLVLGANGECGAVNNSNFGSAIVSSTFDPDLIGGWNHRTTNWEFTTSLQQQLARGIAVDVGYFRRIWANFRVTDNLALSPADFTQFSMVVPTDPRLSTSGQTLSGLYDVVPAKFSTPAQNFNTLADKYGKQIEHWNGVDISLNARLQNGLVLQAGVSTGKALEDNCEIVAQLPEMLNLPAPGPGVAGASTLTGTPAQWRSADFCRREEPMQTSFKGYGVYAIPRIDVQVSGTFRSVPGAAVSPAFTATNAYLATNSTLGRALSGAANMSIGIEVPNEVFTERRNELDVRFGKILRFGRYRSVVSLDLFNALNIDAVTNLSQSYASYLRPTEVLNARVAKISASLEF